MQRVSLFLALIFLFSLLLPSIVFARCGGLCLYEIGIPDVGASGAGQSARANDAATTFTNPAGMTRIDGHQMIVGASVLYFDPQIDLNLEKTVTATPGETNDGGHFGGFTPLGGIYIVSSITDDLKLGFSAGGSVGGSADFNDQWVGRQYIVESNVAILEMTPTLAYRVTDEVSIGAGVRVGYGSLDWDLKATARPEARTISLEDGDDWAVSGIAGILVELSEDTRFGLVYNAKMDTDISGEIKNPTNRTVTFDAQMDIPQGINFAAYHKVDEDIALLADVGWTDWSDFDYQGLQISGGAVAGQIPRNFKDTYRFGLGLEYDDEDPYLLRAGVSFDSSAVPDSARLADTPIDWTWRFSVGGSYDVSETVALGGSYSLIWAGDQEFDEVPSVPGGGVIIDGDIENTIGHALTVFLKWQFGEDNLV